MASSQFLKRSAGPLPGILHGLLLALVSFISVDAQEVRPYPNPGYRRLGVYGGGPESHFDYHLVKLRFGDTFPDKQQYWAGLKARRARQQDSDRHDVYFIYCGERTESLETVTARVDAWLKPEPKIPTYPELIPAISIGEENVGSRDAVLDGLARHIRENYGIPVFQFYSMPLEPNPGLTADGWVFDAYGRQHVEFRKHLMKHVVLDKPVVCIPWASDPHWGGWSRSSDTATMINREWHQFGACMEFDVSCAVFAVAGAGAMNPWLGSQTKDMVKLRNWLRTRRAEMHAFQNGDLPLPSADFSARDRGVPVGGDGDAPSVYEENFSGFAWIHDANVRGFLDLKLTSRPDEPGLLLAKTAPNRKVRASLTYRFESYFPLESVRATLDAAAPAAARCRNELAISTDELGRSWPLTAEQTKSDAIGPLTLNDDGQLRGQHVFYLRITMENDADQQGMPGNRLDRLTVECVHQPPSTPAAAKLVEDAYGNLTYEDGFSTSRWRHLGEMNVGHEDHGGYRNGGFWVGMVGGYATSTQVVQRISSPRELKELVVTADCHADGRNLGGRVVLKIAPRGKDPQWEAGTEGLHRGPLRLEVPARELDGLREFDVLLLLQSGSGVEQGGKACATVTGLKIEAE